MALCDVLDSYFESEPLKQIALDISLRLTQEEVYELMEYLEEYQNG